MKLIHKSTGLEVREGDFVEDFRGDKGIVVGWTKPSNQQSTGRITVLHKHDIEHHCYPSVYSCEWIDREDRETQPVSDTTQAIHGFAQPTLIGGFTDYNPDWSSLETFPDAPVPPKYDLSQLKPYLPPVSSFDQTKELMAEFEEQFKQIRKTLNEIKALLS